MLVDLLFGLFGFIVREWEFIGSSSRNSEFLLVFPLFKIPLFNPGQPVPTRPVCGANDAPNAQLGHILSSVVNAITVTNDEEMRVLCRSTEEMIAEIELINSGDGPDDKEITSSDFDAMFPSLHIETVAKAAGEEFLASKLEIDVDWMELSLYLAVTHTRATLIQLGLGHVTHTRVHRTGPRPGITTDEI